MALAHIGMGGNLPGAAGSPEATLTAAAERLGRLGRVTRRSSLYSTLPVGFALQPRFVNAAVELETALTPRQLLDGLLEIEQEFGRDRSAGIPNGPRTLDLDILAFDGLEIVEPGLELPHPRLAGRAFALVPLCEIDPSLRPAHGRQTVQQLLHNLQFGSEGEADAPIPIQWDHWPAGARHGDTADPAPAGTNAAEAHRS